MQRADSLISTLTTQQRGEFGRRGPAKWQDNGDQNDLYSRSFMKGRARKSDEPMEDSLTAALAVNSVSVTSMTTLRAVMARSSIVQWGAVLIAVCIELLVRLVIVA